MLEGPRIISQSVVSCAICNYSRVRVPCRLTEDLQRVEGQGTDKHEDLQRVQGQGTDKHEDLQRVQGQGTDKHSMNAGQYCSFRASLRHG